MQTYRVHKVYEHLGENILGKRNIGGRRDLVILFFYGRPMCKARTEEDTALIRGPTSKNFNITNASFLCSCAGFFFLVWQQLIPAEKMKELPLSASANHLSHSVLVWIGSTSDIVLLPCRYNIQPVSVQGGFAAHWGIPWNSNLIPRAVSQTFYRETPQIITALYKTCRIETTSGS